MHYASLLFSFKYLVYHRTQIYHICPISELIGSYGLPRTGSQDHQTRIVNMRIKGYSQLTDIVNFFVVSNTIFHLIIPTGYIPPGNPRGLAQKIARGSGFDFPKDARGPGIRQGQGFCGNSK